VDACANLDRHAESVDDEGRKHRSDVLVYDNVGNRRNPNDNVPNRCPSAARATVEATKPVSVS
jgi:hypothetical protein